MLALLIFHAGVVVGSHRGERSRHEVGHGFRPPFLPSGFELPHGFMSNTHGGVGTITAMVTPSTLTIQTREGVDQTVVVSTSTMIRGVRDTGTAPPLLVGDQIVVLGQPDNQGHINAKLIRVLSAATSSTP